MKSPPVTGFSLLMSSHPAVVPAMVTSSHHKGEGDAGRCSRPIPPVTHHYPDPTSSGNPASQRSIKGRRICKLCKRCTSWMCKLCNAPLCLQPDRICFKQFHIELPAV
ncbi:hypothetical protein ATANTOWER_031876 [Ataeniobius toweri]|uniref:PiggyBac transposable element-derived protein 4 C-terminal zinc-ribbon domain-containing protein n=1 Tax=Ataeniobius toweri TaxID=208326 RepID=A0ABU7BN44_9TELE|nr:hypothetical protein [Ataeniobius toweri]